LNRGLHHCLILDSLISTTFQIRNVRLRTIKWLVGGFSEKQGDKNQVFWISKLRMCNTWIVIHSCIHCAIFTCDLLCKACSWIPPLSQAGCKPPFFCLFLNLLSLGSLHWIQVGLRTLSLCSYQLLSSHCAVSNLRVTHSLFVIPIRLNSYLVGAEWGAMWMKELGQQRTDYEGTS
jgi:hypothetical protein